MTSDRRRLLLAAFIASSVLMLVFDGVRNFIESRMLLHMLLEFPWLLLSGAAMAEMIMAYARPVVRAVEKIDYRGLTAITVLLCVSTYWMIPASLDHALLQPGVAIAKYLSWWLAGGLLRLSWNRMSEVLCVFALGNLCWMSGSVGLLYQSSESRLCVNYLFGDQFATGRALVVLAVILGAALAYRVYRSHRALDVAT